MLTLDLVNLLLMRRRRESKIFFNFFFLYDFISDSNVENAYLKPNTKNFLSC